MTKNERLSCSGSGSCSCLDAPPQSRFLSLFEKSSTVVRNSVFLSAMTGTPSFLFVWELEAASLTFASVRSELESLAERVHEYPDWVLFCGVDSGGRVWSVFLELESVYIERNDQSS